MSAPLKFELDRRQGVINIGYGAGSSPSFTNLTVTSTLTVGGSVHGANGSAANPSFAFNSDQDTGLYHINSGNIGVTANGNKVLDIATTGLTVTGALGASSLTAPASTDLTLAGGSSGASLVLGQGTTAANIILTPKGTGNVGIGTASPSKKLDVLGTSETSIRISDTGGSSIEFYQQAVDSYILSTNSVHLYAGGSDRLIVKNTGNVLIGGTTDITGSGGLKVFGTTAGSAGAGALVVTGGLSAGGASYFGGAVTAALSGGQAYVNVGGSPVSLPASYSFVTIAAGNGAVTEYQRTNATARTWRTGVGINGADEFSIHDVTAGGSIAFSIAGATKAATFAGAVSITGNVGFYGQAATAKPTGVAVTAAAIHAALVTLNLIAA